MVHLPPMAALRALDAAARHLSFTRAATELNVTQSAVSHQIKHLEDLWAVKLFERLPRRIELTSAGRALAPVAEEFFSRLERTLADLAETDGHTALQIQVLPSFAVKWLVPRLQAFRDAHPDIDVWITTRIAEHVRFEGGRLDGVIHMGTGEYPGLAATHLMGDQVFPVCRPRFLKEWEVPKEPADLCRLPLMLRQEEYSVPTWESWFERAGVPAEVYAKALSEGTRFPDSNMAIQAAFEGLGVALARRAYVWDDLKSGRLVRLFNVECAAQFSYYLVCPKNRAERPAVAAFREWLVAEAKRAEAEYDDGHPENERADQLARQAAERAAAE